MNPNSHNRRELLKSATGIALGASGVDWLVSSAWAKEALPVRDAVGWPSSRLFREVLCEVNRHAGIKSFWGTTLNAVKIQMYCAIIAYCLVAIIGNKLKVDRTIYELKVDEVKSYKSSASKTQWVLSAH